MLLWMICDQSHNIKINKLHKRALHIACNDYIRSFEDIIATCGYVTIHDKNLPSLEIEMFKMKIKLLPPFIFNYVKKSNVKYQTRSHYSIRENITEKNIDTLYMLTVPGF